MQPKSSIKQIHVGAITAAHGLRGEVKIKSLTSPPEQIFGLGVLSDASGAREFRLKQRSRTDKFFIARVEGVEDRNAADLLRGTSLYAPADSLPEDAREHYIGVQVKLESGADFGVVIAVHNYGAGDILEIELPDGKKELFALTQANFPQIEKKAGWILISPPEEI